MAKKRFMSFAYHIMFLNTTTNKKTLRLQKVLVDEELLNTEIRWLVAKKSFRNESFEKV
jgi:hypothetical protein